MPSREPTPTNGVIRIPLGHVFPSSARLKNPNNALEYQPIISWRPSPFGVFRSLGDQRLDLCPLLIRQIDHLFSHRTYLR